MRDKLKQHLDEYVLCRGWIRGWEDLDECSTRRVFVSKPTIKKADKNLLYQDQQVISIEDHLNLFIKYEDLPTYDAIFELNQPIRFAGFIERYIRGNGSIDYGVSGTKQSAFGFCLDQFINSIRETMHRPLEEIDHLFLEQVSRRILLMAQEVDRAGDHLPTFEKTYQDYKDTLLSLSIALTQTISRARAFLASRNYRRSTKKRFSALKAAQALHSPRKDAKEKARQLVKRLGDL